LRSLAGAFRPEPPSQSTLRAVFVFLADDDSTSPAPAANPHLIRYRRQKPKGEAMERLLRSQMSLQNRGSGGGGRSVFPHL